MQTIKVRTSQNIDIDYEVAGLGERILAFFIDQGIFLALGIITLIVWSTIVHSDAAVGRVFIFCFYALYVIYSPLMELLTNGQSLGKRVMKIKVISLNGGRPSISQYLLRWLFRLVDINLTSGVVAIIAIGASDNNQRLGDIVAGTTLIKTKVRSLYTNLVLLPEEDSYKPVFETVLQLTDKDMELINEVLENYAKTANTVLLHTMNQKVVGLLAIDIPADMTNTDFLETIKRDYKYLTARIDA